MPYTEDWISAEKAKLRYVCRLDETAWTETATRPSKAVVLAGSQALWTLPVLRSRINLPFGSGA
jgi:hypothetical protein